MVVADEGRIGTEVQPGVDADLSARASHEAVAEAGSDKARKSIMAEFPDVPDAIDRAKADCERTRGAAGDEPL